MPCFHPLTGYHSQKTNKNAKRALEFDVSKALLPVPVKVACGRCIGCRLDRARDWALRCVHESQLYEENCFVTLTFDDKHLGDGSLHVADFQKFMKRLRKYIFPRTVRFFHCGEYGEKFSRPHHHACLFGYDFPDKVLFKCSSGGDIYTSTILSELWPFGFSTVGRVTVESAGYVARYVLKKWSKDNLEGQELYDAMKALSDEELKSLHYGGKKPEYITMSRRPGIGAQWYDKYKTDIYPSGFAVLNGKKFGIPRFYDERFELDNVFQLAIIKGERRERQEDNPNNSRRRLEVREQVMKLKTNKCQRGFENEINDL